MSAKQKSQRGFVAITLITILAIALVLIVYATLLGTFQGGQVTVVGVNGQIKYSTTNSIFANTTLSNLPVNASWYARFEKAAGGYTGNVTVKWQLYFNNGTSVHNETTSGFYLNASAQYIYASNNGLQATNYNWGQQTKVAAIYYIKVTVYTE